MSNMPSKEQVIKQNLLTLFRLIEGGTLKEIELNSLVSFIKNQLVALKEESVYGCLDSTFFANLTKSYEFGKDNSSLLNRMYIEAAKETSTAAPRHPWLDIKNNLVDCLQNEVIISCSQTAKSAKTDLTKPEVYVAPDINSIVDLVDKSITSVLKSHVNLSGFYRLVHKGSTARGVSLDNTEFDFDPLFGEQNDYSLFLKRLPAILNSLSEIWRLNGVNILSVDSDNQYQWGRLINLIALDKEGIVFKVQLLAGRDRKSWHEFISDQMAQIKALGGSWEYVSGQIVLFKKLVRDILHGYGKSYGGFDGMMCIEFVLQADSSEEYGRKITSMGSFDKTMLWIYKLGFDQSSSSIYSPDPSKLRLGCSSIFWNKLVNAARRYVTLGKIEMLEDEFASLGL